ncbi:SET-containing protein [Venustampulla echinocandica]|uniref:SET-containing protein n=1 Tax=Venustampulla echinocandica TaxID=2656787 RepID=A0A370TGF1_9HELO|nr:SET-containing protein [Venustampulla echinocandica]RDL33978.1 SET-containing protein [Venustampulla echinocandica]
MSSTNQPNTIFLTPEEDERMRKTLKIRLQKCQLLAGQPRVTSNPKSGLNQVAAASLLSDIAAAPDRGLKSQKARPDTVVAFAVGRPYPPCTLLLQDLQLMRMSDLRIETHHRGRVLTLRRVAPVVKLVALSWTVVQEESSGETERLEVSLHKSRHGQELLESGSIFEVKEPYFTLSDQGDPTLRIDHPSDLVVCKDVFRTDSPRSPTEELGDLEGAVSATAHTSPAGNTAREWKEEGNAALKQQNLLLAHENYTQGLQLVTRDGAAKEDLVCDLFRNRAYVNLILNRLDEARADALASLTGLEDQKNKELDSKAYFRAGCAAYDLGEFQEAKRFFEEQQRLTPDRKDAAARLRQTELRIQEQDTGVYDFKKIKAGLSVGRPRVDAASFTRNVRVGESPGRGRGLFANRDIDSGEIIICEKTFCVVWGHEEEALTAMTYDSRDDRIRVSPAGLCKAIVQKLLDNPSQVGKVMDLYGDYQGIDKQLIKEASGLVIDAFQVHDIVSRNAFGPGSVYSGHHYGEGEFNNASAGLWILASYINHSCISNSEKESMGDLMVLRATRPISANEEITHSYDASSDYDARTVALMNTWGFTCTCTLCIAEKADGPALRKKRQELENEANALVGRDIAVRAKRLSIIKARRLARSINDTYDDERYKDLPRMALLRIQKWLAEAATTR